MTRAHFDHVVRATTRWSDNDMYGHLNNAVYYELFDSAINGWLITGAGIDAVAPPEQGVVAESVVRLLRRARLPGARSTSGSVSCGSGTSSVTYQLGPFDPEAGRPAALGRWVHV